MSLLVYIAESQWFTDDDCGASKLGIIVARIYHLDECRHDPDSWVSGQTKSCDSELRNQIAYSTTH